MAVGGDVMVKQDGRRNYPKIHPHLIAVIRWCVSRVWSTAAIVLHRLAVAPLPQLTGKQRIYRPPSNEHLHPEPKVECVVLHQPAIHTLDVIFVHGLYGSLNNTWRQGDWRSKYKAEPNRVPLKRSELIVPYNCNIVEKNLNVSNVKQDCHFYTYKNKRKEGTSDFQLSQNVVISGDYITRIEIVDDYATQTSIKELFRIDFDDDDLTESDFDLQANDSVIGNDDDISPNDEGMCDCKMRKDRVCEVGCGCVCDECYSSCWPRDWIKVDYPEARVISVNYTSDPHLWRPLWVKPNKRLRLHERADQMIEQLMALGIGTKPIIWVGHSKGGLFIKQIYCEGYEEYLKKNQEITTNLDLSVDVENNKDKLEIKNVQGINCDRNSNKENFINHSDVITKIQLDNNNTNCNNAICDTKDDLKNTESNKNVPSVKNCSVSDTNLRDNSAITKSDLWRNSVGFMFYSVPHRGSPLADIKTPITARSVELLEISKDCNLVLSLHDRWLKATRDTRPQVRSLVETNRTLMSVLWLRIVSVDSADAGIGALCGVGLDHREICKPSSRRCSLYTELKQLIRNALDRKRT